MILEAHAIVKRFGGVTALDDATLFVTPGTIHGLIGPNGAGKSTLIDVVTGNLRADSGTVELDGVDVTGRPPWWLSRAGVGRSFQKLSLFPNLTVGAQLTAATRNEPEASGLAEEMGLAESWRVCANALSYGLQRRLDVALAIAGARKLLILDEPAAGLAPDDAALLGKDLERLVDDRELSILLVEHDLDLVFGICSEVTVLHLGRVIAHGSRDDVRSDPLVRAVYLGEVVP